MEDYRLSSSVVHGLIKEYNKGPNPPLSDPNIGINLTTIMEDIANVITTDNLLYDINYLRHSGVYDIIETIKSKERNITLDEATILINTVDPRLFINFIERHISRAHTTAWDKGTGHALEIRRKLKPLLSIITTIAETVIPDSDSEAEE